MSTPSAAIIFDFDGILVDSEPAHETAFRFACEGVGQTFTHEEYLSHLVGFDDRDTFRAVEKLRGVRFSEVELGSLNALKPRGFERAVKEGRVPPFPGSFELLRAAREAGPIAICSGATRFEIDLVLGHYGLLGLVPIIVSADDVPTSKPSPAPYLLTVQRLGTTPSRCVTMEDTAHGIEAARSAGVKVVGVCHTLPPARLTHADLVVDRIDQLSVAKLAALRDGH
jgi:beta-phosphoglucomutase